MSTQPAGPPENPPPAPLVPPAPNAWDRILDASLFLVVSVAMGFMSYLLWQNLAVQTGIYSKAITGAMDQYASFQTVLSLARASDALTVKISAVFLGFMLSFCGALYVLRSATAAFKMGTEFKGGKGSLETSSPGLVMVALGVVTVCCALAIQSHVNDKTSEEDPVKAVNVLPAPPAAPFTPEKKHSAPRDDHHAPAEAPAEAHKAGAKPGANARATDTDVECVRKLQTVAPSFTELPAFEEGSIQLTAQQTQKLTRAYATAKPGSNLTFWFDPTPGESCADAKAKLVPRQMAVIFFASNSLYSNIRKIHESESSAEELRLWERTLPLELKELLQSRPGTVCDPRRDHCA